MLGFESRIERGNVCSDRASAGATGAADLFLFHFGPAHQIIQRALCIPNPVTGETLPHENALRAGHEMLCGARPSESAADSPVVCLLPFSLAERIVRKD